MSIILERESFCAMKTGRCNYNINEHNTTQIQNLVNNILMFISLLARLLNFFTTFLLILAKYLIADLHMLMKV